MSTNSKYLKFKRCIPKFVEKTVRFTIDNIMREMKCIESYNGIFTKHHNNGNIISRQVPIG